MTTVLKPRAVLDPEMHESELIIEAGRTERQYWRDLWRYRELFYFLALRDVLVRYKQTAIGLAWAVLRPLLTMIVFTVVFNRVAKLPTDGAHYAVLVAAAVVPWQFFASAVAEAGNSLVENGNLLTKIYFPRIIVPGSAIIVSLADCLVSFVILAGVMIWCRTLPSWRIFLLPAFLLIALTAAGGLGLWLAALNAKYRDFRYALPFILQLGLYVSPVGFLSSLLSKSWRLVYAINPMVGVIDGFRWSLGATPFDPPSFAVSCAAAALLLWSGVRHFRGVERSIADLL